MTGVEVEQPEAATVLIDQLSRKVPEAKALVAFRCAQHAERRIKEQVYQDFDPGTGNLARSFGVVALGTDMFGMASAGAVSDLVYAGIQNEGGWIFPRVMQNLAVPAKNAGIKLGQWPRHFPKDSLQFIPSKKPNITGVLVERLAKGSKARAKLLYILMPKVKLKGKRYLEKASEAAQMAYPRITAERLAELVEEAERKAGR